jgi:hypothetical protein
LLFTGQIIQEVGTSDPEQGEQDSPNYVALPSEEESSLSGKNMLLYLLH